MKKFHLTQRHFDKAVEKFESSEHQKWIKTYFPFQEIELEIPPIESIEFSSRKWIDPIWKQYEEACNEIHERPVLDPFRLGFSKFVGGADFDLLDNLEKVIKKEIAFSKSIHTTEKTSPTPKKPIKVKPLAMPIKKGWVYLIKSKDRYKIGQTANLLRRMNQLKAADKTNDLIHAVRCESFLELEKELHSLYDQYRYQGSEIFNLNCIQIDEVQNIMNQRSST